MTDPDGEAAPVDSPTTAGEPEIPSLRRSSLVDAPHARLLSRAPTSLVHSPTVTECPALHPNTHQNPRTLLTRAGPDAGAAGEAVAAAGAVSQPPSEGAAGAQQGLTRSLSCGSDPVVLSVRRLSNIVQMLVDMNSAAVRDHSQVDLRTAAKLMAQLLQVSERAPSVSPAFGASLGSWWGAGGAAEAVAVGVLSAHRLGCELNARKQARRTQRPHSRTCLSFRRRLSHTRLTGACGGCPAGRHGAAPRRRGVRGGVHQRPADGAERMHRARQGHPGRTQPVCIRLVQAPGPSVARETESELRAACASLLVSHELPPPRPQHTQVN
jgi:hypothetical protein